MVAHFVRRTIAGIAIWLATTFILYSLLISPGIPNNAEIDFCCDRQLQQRHLYRIYGTFATYALEKHWPQNYSAWMWEPEGVVRQSFRARVEFAFGVVLPAKAFEFSRSGLLRGDFGVSVYVVPSTPAMAVYGLDFGLLLGSLNVVLLGSMLVAILQRRGRSPVYSLTARDRIIDPSAIFATVQ